MAEIIRKFSVDDLENKYDLPWNPIAEETVDKRRWYSVVDLVFKADDGYHYLVQYCDPATEMQDGQDRWWYDPMPATRVELRPVVQKIWCPVDDELIFPPREERCPDCKKNPGQECWRCDAEEMSFYGT